MSETKEKYQKMVDSIGKMGKVALGFSGGVDSTLLLKACLDSGAETTVFMAVGEIFIPEEQKKAVSLAKDLGVELLTFRVDLVNEERFARNWEDRCYVCKSAIFQRIKDESKQREIPYILEGSQLDDLKEIRAGRGALLDLNIRSPLIEAKLNKKEVRSLLKELGMPNWDAPSNTCLATRVPFDVRVNKDILKRVERAEALLAPYGFRSLRVRDHGYWARIEVAPEDLPKLFAERVKIVEELGRLGYRNVAMDLAGYSH